MIDFKTSCGNILKLYLPLSADASQSVFDSSEFIEESNYFRVEPTLECHHKESVQVCKQNNIYLDT